MMQLLVEHTYTGGSTKNYRVKVTATGTLIHFNIVTMEAHHIMEVILK